MILRNVMYEGRPIFYRISNSGTFLRFCVTSTRLSIDVFYPAEMVVPYGDPRSPVHRKSAYDFGECGAGQAANNLQLGCDCLGVIHCSSFSHFEELSIGARTETLNRNADIDGLSVSPDGTARKMPNVICMHEQDAGIGWKHTNVRTGRADVTRARELVLQLILTVGNYEYGSSCSLHILYSKLAHHRLISSVLDLRYRWSAALGDAGDRDHVGDAHL